MSFKVQELLHSYGALLLVLLSVGGYGVTFSRVWAPHSSSDRQLDTVLSLALGLGILICGLQWIGVSGHFNRRIVNVLLFTGWLCAAHATWRHWWKNTTPIDFHTWQPGWPATLLLVSLVPTVIAPLLPPIQWDEIMYHLPHALAWAEKGRVSPNEWLRYPWFPFNIDLLYGAALIFKRETLAHLLNALSGWLVTALIYLWASRFLSRWAGLLAALIWVSISPILFFK